VAEFLMVHRRDRQFSDLLNVLRISSSCETPVYMESCFF